MVGDRQSEREVNERIRLEHEEVRNHIKSIHCVISEREASVDEAAKLMSSFYRKLACHFLDEEDEGFFEQINNLAPELGRVISKLCEEHLEMLEMAKTLTEQAQSGDGSTAWWNDLESAFDAFTRRLMHHESQENQLLQQIYGEDIGAHD